MFTNRCVLAYQGERGPHKFCILLARDVRTHTAGGRLVGRENGCARALLREICVCVWVGVLELRVFSFRSKFQVLCKSLRGACVCVRVWMMIMMICMVAWGTVISVGDERWG